MHSSRYISLLTALASGGLTLVNSHGALTSGLAYAAFNLPNPDAASEWSTTEPTGAVPGSPGVSGGSTAWSNISNTAGGYVNDGGGDGIQSGAAAIWNSVGATSQQDGPAIYVTQLYRGFIYDPDGMFAFSENIDDNVQVKVDGVVVLMNNQTTQTGAWQSPTSTLSDASANGDVVQGNTAWGSLSPLQQSGNFGAGWHLIEVRLGEFGGTGGPPNQADTLGGANWSNTFGFGIAGIGNGALPTGPALYDALSYVAFDAANFGLAPDGGPALRYDNIDPTGNTNIIIPEPSGWMLLIGGLSLGLLGRRRRA